MSSLVGLMLRGPTPVFSGAQTDLTVIAASYANLTTARPTTATVRCSRGASSPVDISTASAPVWVDLNDGNGGGVCVSDDYTATTLAALPTTAGQAPLVVSGSHPGPVTMRATDPSLIVQGGDIDIEVEWIYDHRDEFDNWFLDEDIWSGTGPDGEVHLRYKWSITAFELMVRGVVVANLGAGGGNGGNGICQKWRQNSLGRLRCWYRPSTGQYGLRHSINGVWANRQVGSTTGGALSALTSFYWGSNFGTSNHMLARHTDHKVYAVSQVPTAPLVKGLCFGDSNAASYNGTNVAGKYLRVSERRLSSCQMMSFAVPGETTSAQTTRYNNSEYKTMAGVTWAIIRIGLNDIGTLSASTQAAQLQTLVDTLRADHPGIQVFLSLMTPIRQELINTNPSRDPELYNTWTAMNRNFLGPGGGGADPIQRTAGCATVHNATLDDGTGRCVTTYCASDGTHLLNNGRDVVAASEVALLRAGGALPV